MIRLNYNGIQTSSLQYLKSVQSLIAREPSFEAKVRKADSKWKGKTSGAGELVFRDIKTTLIQMCVGIEICAYCEQNEATDIEHIFPKKLYPEKAFSWDNYVLACSKCNSHHKQDKFRIFNPTNSSIEENVTPVRKTYRRPANEDSLFINQRIEDPMDYFELDLVNRQFIFTERFPIGTREFKKAKFTKEVLGLNTRAALVANRKNAAKFYTSRLEKYVVAKASTGFQELVDSISDDWGGIDQTKNFIDEKSRILNSIKEDILTYSHPTVWKELIRQRQDLPKTNFLLNQAPEVLGW
jgi:uncharacterized protein (TIGR02646 family)